MTEPAAFREAQQLLRRASSCAVLSGAGLSAESGMPTFRGAGGLWRSFSVEDLASPEGFARDPAAVWEWYAERRKTALDCRPHAGHEALVELERRLPVTHVTQNVDGLLQRAGCARVLELHGSLLRARCAAGCSEELEDHVVPVPFPRTCDACGALLRPAVVWFGELLPEDVLLRSMAAVRAADVLLVVGTSACVHPAAGLADTALEAGAAVIEVNPEPTPFTGRATLALSGRAGAVLSEIVGSKGRRPS